VNSPPHSYSRRTEHVCFLAIWGDVTPPTASNRYPSYCCEILCLVDSFSLPPQLHWRSNCRKDHPETPIYTSTISQGFPHHTTRYLLCTAYESEILMHDLVFDIKSMSYVLETAKVQLPAAGLHRKHVVGTIVRDALITGTQAGDLCVFNLTSKYLRFILRFLSCLRVFSVVVVFHARHIHYLLPRVSSIPGFECVHLRSTQSLPERSAGVERWHYGPRGAGPRDTGGLWRRRQSEANTGSRRIYNVRLICARKGEVATKCL